MKTPTRYDLAYFALAPVALPYLAVRWARKRKYRQSGPGMMGRNLPEGAARAPFAEGSVWIHAVSVGEVAAAKAVEPHLRGVFPGRPFVISTVTETGQEATARSLPDVEARTYFPLDFSWNVARFLDAYNPAAVVIMETEIWPNFVTLARQRGAPVFWVNGKLSDRSFPRYQKVRGILRPVFDAIRGFCAQTEEDARRFEALGIARERIRVTGNVKFDLAIKTLDATERVEWRAKLGVRADQPVVVAGSTHEGEEEMLFAAMREVQEVMPDAVMILAPRHPERFAAVAELARAGGFRVRRASEGENAAESAPQIVVLDTMGVLARAYGLGEIGIVAGSWCPTGGHNLLEAAAHAVPVVFGPNMKSQREIAHLFKMGGAGTQVESGTLAATLINFLRDPGVRSAEGAKALKVLQNNQGAAERSAEAIRGWL